MKYRSYVRRSPSDWVLYGFVGLVSVFITFAYAVVHEFGGAIAGALCAIVTLFMSGVLYARRLVELGKLARFKVFRDPSE